MLTVFAASSLTEAFTELAGAFEAAHPGSRVALSFAGSSTLRTQLEQGAHADVFASADERQMELAARAGLVWGAAQTFATNRFVVVVWGKSAVASLGDLATPGVRIVLAQPEVPAGAYARQALARMAADPQYGQPFADKVMANVVSLEFNVRAVVSKLRLGEADAGFAYATDVAAGDEGLRLLLVPAAYAPVPEYPAAVLQAAKEPVLALAFLDFLLGPDGQRILQRHGFGGPLR